MKKQYMIPETEVVRFHTHNTLLVASLTGGEVGAPEMPFDDLPAVPDITGMPDLPVMPDLPGM